MPFSYRHLFFGGTTFCCCLPVRMGVISMAILGCLVSGSLAVLLWFEVASTTGLTSSGRAAFILAALMETILFATSIFGLMGAIVRKQLFIQVYAYVLYVHFVINLAVAGYLLFEISRASDNLEVLACKTAIKNPGAESQCTGLLSIAKWVYLIVALIVLFVELYGAVIVTRYLNQLQRQKRTARASRMQINEAFQLKPSNGFQYSRLHDYMNQPTTSPDPYSIGPYDVEFNPYEEGARSPGGKVLSVNHMHELDNGSGPWTRNDIVAEGNVNLNHENELPGGFLDQQKAQGYIQ
ncbi:hypothetical protein BYT27DRAFT_7140869 [Phlegmacium glaucopus]|nr:hypothetical protein BYT27DRAFT_7140869 [Phlegmacium glaucopus]